MRIHSTLAFIALLSASLSAQVPSYVPTNGLVGWWPFEGNADDASGNGNNGTVTGATLTFDRFGLNDKAYSFNGVNNWIEVAQSPSLNSLSTELSVAAWFSVDSYVDNRFPLLEKSNTLSGDVQVSLMAHDVNSLPFGIVFQDIQGFTANNISNYLASVGFQNWAHVVITMDGASIKTYANGALVLTVSQVGTLTATNHSLWFGRSPFGPMEYADGLLDDIGIWNRALDPCEVQALFNAGSQGVSPIPVSFTGLNSSYTLADTPSQLVGSPAGGVFIGPGVSGSTFDPATAGVGNHTVIYSYVDECGSVNSSGFCTEVTLNVGSGGSQMGTDGVRVFPNPNRGQFTIELDLTGLVGLQVFDTRGSLVHSEVFQASGARTQRSLDLSSLAQGNYTLQVQNEGQRITQTVVVE